MSWNKEGKDRLCRNNILISILSIILRVERMSLQNNVRYCEVLVKALFFFSVVQEMDVSLVSWFFDLLW